MGRRDDETEDEALPVEVEAALNEVSLAFGRVGYPNEAMDALGRLAIVEYRGARRAIDRRQWHTQLLAVARQCGGADEADEVAPGPGELDTEF
jgi:hypothetical protein